ncbi:F0F1 ATP synthase subunit delta [Brachybacterium epidermidis]|uniref:F0F1 ATP synthase subunit delta n=1 Tax=Brachybacterium epidermidis TaxID=2781983 RepID=UPI00398F71AD
MRGTSSTSLGEVLRHVECAQAVPTDSLESGAEQLFSVADAIDSSNQLVRLLSDAGRPAEVKESAVSSLFADKVSPQALEVTREVVRRRWSEQEDILDALELAGVAVLLGQAEREDVLGAVEDEMFQVSRMIDRNGELHAALDDARERPEQRARIVQAVLQGRVHRITLQLVTRAVTRRSDVKPARRISEFARFASDRRRRSFASVTSAIELSEAQKARLGAILTGIYGRDIHMNVQVDPEVVGGLRIQVGDDLYDATVLARLARAKRQLVS